VLRDGATVGVVDLASSGQEEIVSLMLGAEAAEVVVSEGSVADRESGSSAERRPAVEVRGLRSGVVHDVSFTLNSGEVLGIVALEGQGQVDLFGKGEVDSLVSQALYQSKTHIFTQMLERFCCMRKEKLVISNIYDNSIRGKTGI